MLSYGTVVLVTTALVGVQTCQEIQFGVKVFSSRSVLIQFGTTLKDCENSTLWLQDLKSDTQQQKGVIQGNYSMFSNLHVGSWKACVALNDTKPCCKDFNIPESTISPAATNTPSTSPPVNHFLIYIRISIYIGVCILVCLLLVVVLNRLTIRPKKDIVHTYLKTSQEVLVNEP